MIGRPISELTLGEHAEVTHLASQEMVGEFVEAVGDHNPVHSDNEFAARTPFGRPIAPGLWTAGLLSGVIGTTLPGPGCLYISQTLFFLKPVLLGDAITARVEIVEVLPDRNRIRMKTVCTNQRGEEVLTGEAWVKPPKTRIVYAESSPFGRPVAVAHPSPMVWGATALKFWSGIARAVLARMQPADDAHATRG